MFPIEPQIDPIWFAQNLILMYINWNGEQVFLSMTCMLIQIKFDVDINNDELLKTIWKHKKKRKLLIITGRAHY
jgi:hypothetical protein